MKKEITNNYYYDTETDTVYNSKGYPLKCVDGKVKIKINNKTKTINIVDYQDKPAQDYVDFQTEKEPAKWLFKCNETKDRFNSIDDCANKYGINKRLIYLVLNNLRKTVCGYTFTYNNYKMKGMIKL